MTTLAQKIIENNLAAPGPEDEPIPEILQMAVQLTRSRLNAPNVEKFHVIERDGTSCREDAFRVLTATSERFMFQDDNPCDVVLDHIEAGTLDQNVMFNVAKLPVDHAWIEWRTRDRDDIPETMLFGVLLDSTVEMDVRERELNGVPKAAMSVFNTRANGSDKAPPGFISGILYSALRDTSATPLFTFNMTKGFSDPNSKLKVTWQADIAQEGYDKMNFVQSILIDISCLLFLLNTPRATETIEHRWPEKLQKARRKRNKVPLVEFKKILVRIGSPQPKIVRHPNLSAGHDARRRLHQVIGHFRTYTKHHEDKPLVAWVNQHWRGDAELGIVLHERNIKQD
jgi:hypothetical protein